MIGTSSKKELDHRNTMLPLNNDFPDVWKTAGPVTKISESPFPFDDNGQRPTANEVRYQ